MKQTVILIALLALFSLGCSNSPAQKQEPKTEIECDDEGCRGVYVGPEFIKGSDVAHQFSNTMSHHVGEKLKELYGSGDYVKVDLNHIKMTTKGMGSGIVTYTLNVPFIRVSEKCLAYTSFDHSGGWNHTPAIHARKEQLSKALLPGEKLDISPLLKTPEGLEEYWIQWKNKDTQKECASQ